MGRFQSEMAFRTTFDLDRVAEGERELGLNIQRCLESMVSVADQFQSALDLYLDLNVQINVAGLQKREIEDEQIKPLMEEQRRASPALGELFERVDRLRERRQTLAGWQQIAARSGAVLAYDLYQVAQNANEFLGKAPGIRAIIDKEARRGAADIFSQAFPDFADARHVAAHPGEFFSNQDKLDENAAATPMQTSGGEINISSKGTFTIGGMLTAYDDGCRFTSTVNGKLINFELSPRTTEATREFSRLYVRCFAAIMQDDPRTRRA